MLFQWLILHLQREREKESDGAGGRGRDRGSRISPGLEPGVDCNAFNNGDDLEDNGRMFH